MVDLPSTIYELISSSETFDKYLQLFPNLSGSMKLEEAITAFEGSEDERLSQLRALRLLHLIEQSEKSTITVPPFTGLIQLILEDIQHYLDASLLGETDKIVEFTITEFLILLEKVLREFQNVHITQFGDMKINFEKELREVQGKLSSGIEEHSKNLNSFISPKEDEMNEMLSTQLKDLQTSIRVSLAEFGSILGKEINQKLANLKEGSQSSPSLVGKLNNLYDLYVDRFKSDVRISELEIKKINQNTNSMVIEIEEKQKMEFLEFRKGFINEIKTYFNETLSGLEREIQSSGDGGSFERGEDQDAEVALTEFNKHIEDFTAEMSQISRKLKDITSSLENNLSGQIISFIEILTNVEKEVLENIEFNLDSKAEAIKNSTLGLEDDKTYLQISDDQIAKFEQDYYIIPKSSVDPEMNSFDSVSLNSIFSPETKEQSVKNTLEEVMREIREEIANSKRQTIEGKQNLKEVVSNELTIDLQQISYLVTNQLENISSFFNQIKEENEKLATSLQAIGNKSSNKGKTSSANLQEIIFSLESQIVNLVDILSKGYLEESAAVMQENLSKVQQLNQKSIDSLNKIEDVKIRELQGMIKQFLSLIKVSENPSDETLDTRAMKYRINGYIQELTQIFEVQLQSIQYILRTMTLEESSTDSRIVDTLTELIAQNFNNLYLRILNELNELQINTSINQTLDIIQSGSATLLQKVSLSFKSRKQQFDKLIQIYNEPFVRINDLEGVQLNGGDLENNEAPTPDHSGKDDELFGSIDHLKDLD